MVAVARGGRRGNTTVRRLEPGGARDVTEAAAPAVAQALSGWAGAGAARRHLAMLTGSVCAEEVASSRGALAGRFSQAEYGAGQRKLLIIIFVNFYYFTIMAMIF